MSELQKSIIADTHVHSYHSHDSKALISDIKSTAEKTGVDIVCITDHCDIEFCDKIDVKKIITESINDSKRHNSGAGAQILSGVEIGEAIWNRREAEKILALDGLDQVIGSVHAVRYDGYTQPYATIDFSAFTRDMLEKFLAAYFNDVLEMVTTTEFDILAHLTCPLRYINGTYSKGADCHIYQDKIKEILSEIIKREIALEINTSNCLSNYDELMPEEWIIKMYKDMGGQLITCASDAHIDKRLGHQFDRLYKLIKKYDFRYVCYFKGRKIHKCLV